MEKVPTTSKRATSNEVENMISLRFIRVYFVKEISSVSTESNVCICFSTVAKSHHSNSITTSAFIGYVNSDVSNSRKVKYWPCFVDSFCLPEHSWMWFLCKLSLSDVKMIRVFTDKSLQNITRHGWYRSFRGFRWNSMLKILFVMSILATFCWKTEHF